MEPCKAKRKVLSIEEKVRIIRECESGRKRTEVCRKFELVNSTLGTILKNKDKIFKTFDDNGEKVKKIRKCEKTEVDEALMGWFKQCRTLNLPVSGPILKEKAEEFGKLFGTEFVCSNGWLDRFKARHSISFGKSSADRAKRADAAAVNLTDDWRQNTWPDSGQKPAGEESDIYNGEEAGISDKSTAEKPQNVKKKKCVGRKPSEESVTASVRANVIETEKKKSPAVGKRRAPPRCLKNVRKLPVGNCASKRPRKAQLPVKAHINGAEIDNISLFQWIQQFSAENEMRHELEEKNVEANDSDEEVAEQDEDSDDAVACPTAQEAMTAAKTLSRFYHSRKTPAETLIEVDRLYKVTENIYFRESKAQKKITDFFQRYSKCKSNAVQDFCNIIPNLMTVDFKILPNTVGIIRE